MIEKMEKLFIYGLSGNAQEMLGELMKCGCLQISHPEELEGYEELKELMIRETVDLYQPEQLLSRLSASISAVSPYCKKKSFFEQKPVIAFEALSDKKSMQAAWEICSEVEAIQKVIGDKKTSISKTQFLMESLKPWRSMDLSMAALTTKTTVIQLMTIPVSISMESLETTVTEAGLAGILFFISEDQDQHYVAVVSHKADAAGLDELLRQNGASRVAFELNGTPAENLATLDRQTKVLQQELAECEKQMAKLAESADTLKLAYDSVQTRIQQVKARQELLATEQSYLLAAWIPVRQKPTVEKVLSKYPCYYEYQIPQSEEETPVLLKNNRMTAPFESVTEMYSLPASNSMDPNPFMAPFFFLFFGMMLSDAGYGIILTVAGLLGAKLTGSKLMKMLGYCGISTIFWGALYGSWFGDAIPKVAEVFFGKTISIPTLIDPLKDPITVLLLSFIFGAMHLFVGMGLKAYLMVKRGHPWQAFFDVGFWYFVLVGLALLIFGGLPAEIGKWMAIFGAVGLVLTQGRDKKNIFMKFASGLLSLYGITGYFSDVLSYSRIMALGLATGVIATVINTMGTMPGGNFLGFIVFILVFIFGHLLNLGINALGSYVHTSRLQYVEFFGKFFEGGGQAFHPFTVNTKYFSINKQEAEQK